MPRRIVEKPCGCGCGEMTRGGEFRPGHDSKLLSAIIEAAGGVQGLRDLVQASLKRRIQVVHD